MPVSARIRADGAPDIARSITDCFSSKVKMKSTDCTNRNLITALYCRLSQEDERLGESLSIENQRLMLQKYAEEHRFPNLQFYVDDGFSGADFNRPSFKRILCCIPCFITM